MIKINKEVFNNLPKETQKYLCPRIIAYGIASTICDICFPLVLINLVIFFNNTDIGFKILLIICTVWVPALLVNSYCINSIDNKLTEVSDEINKLNRLYDEIKDNVGVVSEVKANDNICINIPFTYQSQNGENFELDESVVQEFQSYLDTNPRKEIVAYFPNKIVPTSNFIKNIDKYNLLADIWFTSNIKASFGVDEMKCASQGYNSFLVYLHANEDISASQMIEICQEMENIFSPILQASFEKE